MVVQKFRSFEEADKADRAYYLSLTPKQRVDMMLEIIRTHHTGGRPDVDLPRFSFVYRVVQRKLG
jgi:hypothetical protein